MGSVQRTLRILVVDDDRMLARAVARALRSRGHVVKTTHSVAEAKALSERFDAAVLDMNLGDGSGIDLAHALFEAHAVQAVTFFSGSSDPQDRLHTTDYGSFVHKGEGVDALIGALHDAVNEAEVAAAASGAEGLSATQSPQHRPVTGARRKKFGR